MNKFSNIVIGTRDERDYEVLIVSCQNSKGVLETVELFRSFRFSNWELSEVQLIRSNAGEILKHFLHDTKAGIMELPYPYNHRVAITLDAGVFPTKGRAYYDRKNLY